jgi:glyoxylase-like metal-dependent hydrolase (beta-lactamase superfamily II)
MSARSSRSLVTIDCDPQAPQTVAAYLRLEGGEAAFVETNTQKTLPALEAALVRSGVAPEAVRWIVVTHVHLDHAGGASALLARCPNATLLAHPRAARHLIDPSRLVASATGVYGAERFAELYGTIEPAPEGRVRALADGETFALGNAELRVHHTRGHANHHFVVADPAMDTVFTGDSFGVVYPQLQRAGTYALASTSPTDFDPEAAHETIDRIVGFGSRTLHPTHFGAIGDLPSAAAQLHEWIDASARWLDAASGSGQSYEENKRIIERAMHGEMQRQADRVGLALGKEDWALLALDLDLNSQGIAFVAGRNAGQQATPLS